MCPTSSDLNMSIVDYLGLVVTTCVLNQSNGHWLLYDALNFFITWSLKMREKTWIQTTFGPLMDDGRITLELYLLASNKKRLLGFLTFFLHSYKAMKNKIL